MLPSEAYEGRNRASRMDPHTRQEAKNNSFFEASWMKGQGYPGLIPRDLGPEVTGWLVLSRRLRGHSLMISSIVSHSLAQAGVGSEYMLALAHPAEILYANPKKQIKMNF